MSLRNTNIDKLQQENFDVLVIGGGINGASCAAALAGKGAKVAVIDRADFASETSQASSNLIWGGIKYLEGWEFSLVRKLCLSRNKLCRNFPSSVREIRFFTAHNHNTRYPRFFLYLGTWLYWLIGNGFTKKPSIYSKKFVEKKHPTINTQNCSGAIEYSDAYLMDNDSRFVFNFISSATRQGAICANYIEAQGSQQDESGWTTTVKDLENNHCFHVRSKVIVNACGPHVDYYNKNCGQKTKHQHIFSKGVHIIVDQITPVQKVLTFFANDGRMFFVVPMGNKSCIGTTDTKVSEPKTHVTQEDRDFILENINHLLRLEKPLTCDDIISERCGVRPLVVEKHEADQAADWLKLSRKHIIEARDNFISIFGGKLTDCLNVGNEVVRFVEQCDIDLADHARRWYGESSKQCRDHFFYQAKILQIPREYAKRWWRFYDIDAFELLANIRSNGHLQELLIPEIGYYRCEAEFMRKREIITKLSDFLRRRTNLAMIMNEETLRNHHGVKEAAKLLFPKSFHQQWQEYFSKHRVELQK